MQKPVAHEHKESLFILRQTLVAKLPNNFDHVTLDTISSQILQEVSRVKRIKSVIFDMADVTTVDQLDLNALLDTMKAVRLIGARIGLCSISPGVSALIVKSGLQLPYQAAGHDIEDIISKIT